MSGRGGQTTPVVFDMVPDSCWRHTTPDKVLQHFQKAHEHAEGDGYMKAHRVITLMIGDARFVSPRAVAACPQGCSTVSTHGVALQSTLFMHCASMCNVWPRACLKAPEEPLTHVW